MTNSLPSVWGSISAVLGARTDRAWRRLRAALNSRMAPEAGSWISDHEQRDHFMISGATRSGKSLMLALYLRGVIAHITPGSDRRLVLFDPKNELNPAPFGDARVPVRFLLPSDARGARWDVARDLGCRPAAIRQFCRDVVPEISGDRTPFFTAAVQELMAGVIESLDTTHPGRWDLADVLRILGRRNFLAQILGRTPASRSKLRFIGEARTWEGIEATLQTRLDPLRALAALWAESEETFSLRDFAETEGILVLGHDPRDTAPSALLNRALLEQLFAALLGRGDSPTRRTHLVFDELSCVAGDRPLAGLKDLCLRGASRGVVVAATFQSYADIKKLYGDDAEAILDLLWDKIFLRAGDAPTAKFASEAFARTRAWFGDPVYPPPGAPCTTTSDRWRAQDPVPYKEFLRLPGASRRDGISGYRLSPGRRAGPFHLPGRWIAANLPERRGDVGRFRERACPHDDLEPLGRSDLGRLDLRLAEGQDDGEGEAGAAARAEA